MSEHTGLVIRLHALHPRRDQVETEDGQIIRGVESIKVDDSLKGRTVTIVAKGVTVEQAVPERT